MSKTVITTTIETFEDTPAVEMTPAREQYRRWSQSKKAYVWLHEMHQNWLLSSFKKETEGMTTRQILENPYFVEMLRLISEKAEGELEF